MDYFIIKYSKMRQQEIRQEFEVIHKARMSRPEGINRRSGGALRDLKNVLFTRCCHLGRRGRLAWSAE